MREIKKRRIFVNFFIKKFMNHGIIQMKNGFILFYSLLFYSILFYDHKSMDLFESWFMIHDSWNCPSCEPL